MIAEISRPFTEGLFMKASKILCSHQKNWREKIRLETSTSGVQLRYCRTVRNEDEGGQAEVVWTCHEERPRVCRKKDDGNEVTGKEEKRETEEEISWFSERRYGESWCKGEGH